MGHMFLETIQRHMGYKKIISDKKHDFTKGKLCPKMLHFMMGLQQWWMRKVLERVFLQGHVVTAVLS